MPPPLSLIPLAMAAGDGKIDDCDARQLVAAGVTMLQRCAPLVKALTGARGALLLRDPAECLVALAGCEGHGAVLLGPSWNAERVRAALERTGATVVFTVERHARRVPDGVPLVLLDELPGHVVFSHGATRRTVDVGSHFGLAIEGEESEGSDEEAVVAFAPRSPGGSDPGECLPGHARRYSHRALLNFARAVATGAAISESDVVSSLLPLDEAAGLGGGLVAPCIGGARVATTGGSRWSDPARALEASGCTVLVGDDARFASLARALDRDGGVPARARLRAAVVVGDTISPATAECWKRVGGAPFVRVAPPEAHSL